MNGKASRIWRKACAVVSPQRPGISGGEGEESLSPSWPRWFKKIVTWSLLAFLWAWFMIGIDSSPELDRHAKVVLFERSKFDWVARNLGAPVYYPQRIFDAQPPLVDLPTLQALAGDTRTDREIIARVLSYFLANRNMLRERWQEADSQRVQALFAMNIIHLSHPYGPSETPRTLADYVHRTASSSCRMYAMFQSKLLEAFGLPWRYVAISSGLHGWIEVKIGKRWEIFDSTANVWIDQSALDLIDGRPRRYRWFYTPWSDADRPDARRFVTQFVEPYYDTAGGLRSNMPGLGIYFMTEPYLNQEGLRIEVWKKFCPEPFDSVKCPVAS
jgi:hypothetical protein